MNKPPSTEERIWAVLSHLSAIAFGTGILLPIIGWSEQRRKSKYASFQCLQALGYQSLGFTVWLLAYLLLVVVFMISMLVLIGITGAGSSDTFINLWTGIFIITAFGGFGLYLLFPVIAAIACALGKDFHYPIMGQRLARYLGNDSNDVEWLSEDHEDRWVIAMGHFSVIIALWGMLAPLTAWIMQGKRSLFVKFQSVQTLVYQVGVTLLFFGAGLIYMFGFFLFIVMTGLAGNINQTVGVIALVVLFGSMSIGILILLIVPLFHIMGQWAGYRVLKGEDYRYPVVGRMVEKWLARHGSQTHSEHQSAS